MHTEDPELCTRRGQVAGGPLSLALGRLGVKTPSALVRLRPVVGCSAAPACSSSAGAAGAAGAASADAVAAAAGAWLSWLPTEAGCAATTEAALCAKDFFERAACPLARWASSATISASSCAACAACARTATVCARTAAISRAVCASACFCALRLRACCSISVASSCVLPGLGDLGCRRPVLIAQLGVGPRLQQSPRACLVALVSRVHQGGGGAAAAPLIRVGMVPQENAQEGKVATSRSSHERGATAAVRQVDARAAPQQLPRQP